jgi:hypothetical protein
VDPLEAVFVFCFVFGVATSVLSLLLGSLHGGDAGHALPSDHGAGALGGHLGHAGHVGHLDHTPLTHGHPGGPVVHGADGHGGDLEPSAAQVSPFNLQTVTTFLAFFGGVGWVLYDSVGLAPAIALIAGVAAGIVGGGAVFWFLVRVLIAGQRFMDPSSSRMEGTVGTVTWAIGATTTGEIVFSRDGTRHSEGARSATGLPIPVGTEVVIVRYENGLAHVEPWASFSADS